MVLLEGELVHMNLLQLSFQLLVSVTCVRTAEPRIKFQALIRLLFGVFLVISNWLTHHKILCEFVYSFLLTTISLGTCVYK